MTIKYPYLEDGTPLKAAELNTRFGQVFEGLNLLHPESVGLGAFRHNHLPCLVGPADYSEDELSVADGFTSRTELSFNPAEVDCVVITSEKATTLNWAGADTIISCMTGSDFPSFQVGHQHADEVGAVVLLGNFHIEHWLLADPAKTTSYRDLNEDTLAVQAAFKLHYTTSAGASATLILERSQRALSPRLSVSKEALASPQVALSGGIYEASTNAEFDNQTHAETRKITIIDDASAAIDIETLYPDLWTVLNSTDDDDDLVFSFSGIVGPTLIPLAEIFTSGVLVDKAETLALHAAGTKNVIKAQLTDVPDDNLPDWDGVANTTAWTIVQLTGAGAPMYSDKETEQDLVMRSVLFSDDLPDRATLNQVSIVATQEGAMVGDGKYKVVTNKANLTALPLHVKRET
jgi:hypothetical protein